MSLANAITAALSLSVSNGNLSRSKTITGQFAQSAASPSVAAGAPSISASGTGTQISYGSLATQGWGWFHNLDTANYVELGVVVSGTFYPLTRLLAGEMQLFRVSPSATLYAKANTAAVLLEYEIYDN
jgi:PKD repeat protein